MKIGNIDFEWHEEGIAREDRNFKVWSGDDHELCQIVYVEWIDWVCNYHCWDGLKWVLVDVSTLPPYPTVKRVDLARHVATAWVTRGSIIKGPTK